MAFISILNIEVMFRINFNLFRKREIVMKVRVIKKCYFGERVHKPGAILELTDDDMNKGKNGKLELPSWAERVNSKAVEKESEGKKTPEPTTLHEMAGKKVPNVSKPAKKK